ncbi:MAG: PKD domain-containing protein [Thermoplasmatota archaeon]
MPLDPRTPERVRSSALSVLDTEDDVIIHRKAGADHPPSSRLMGLYLPVDMDDPDYAELVIAETTAWDDTARLYVREMDARPQPLNWTEEKPLELDFVLRTLTPEAITKVEVQVIEGGEAHDLTLSGSGGLFSGSYETGEGLEVRYRFRVHSIYGGAVDFPPDGYNLIRFEAEAQPPEVWHEPPAVISIGPSSGGLLFYIRDSTGIELNRPENVPRLEYREKGKTSWYSKPLVQGNGAGFNGWMPFSETPSGMNPGSRIEYRVVVEDVIGNSATWPSTGLWESLMGVGARFVVDGIHSDISDHGLFLDEFTEMGMVLDVSLEEDGMEDMPTYKGYVLIMPDEPIPPARVEAIAGFINDGGELLIVMDPADSHQASQASLLLERFDVDPTPEGSVNGFLPSNSYSELGGRLPAISGTTSGSFRVAGDQTPVYYTEPPLISMYTDRFGYGRIVVSHSDIFDDEMMKRDANRQLADRVIGYLHENLMPVVGVEITPEGVVTPGQTITFNLSGSYDPDGEVVQYSLSLSDNTYLENSDPVFQHVFLTSGTFTVLLKAYDEEGEIGSLTVTVKVNRPPTTDVGISSINVYAGEEVTFTYKGMDPDGDEIIAEWDFGDGFKVSGLLVRHTYKRRGEYTFTVVVRDSNGLESERSGTITVMNSDPTALIDRDNILVNGAPGNFSGELKVTLYAVEGDTVRIPGDLSYDPDQNEVLNFTWDLGDGNKAYDRIVIHRFMVSGLLKVTLTVEDGVGGIDTTELFVSVDNREPFAAFEYSSKDGGKVTFDATLSTDDPWDMAGLEYRWDFGDGDKKVTLDPVIEHDYTFGGEYRVKLTVADGDGAQSTFVRDVNARGIRPGVVVALVASILVILAVLSFMGWRRLHDRMLREDKGLLQIMGFGTGEETPMDDHPGSFRRPKRQRGGEPAMDERRRTRLQKDRRSPPKRGLPARSRREALPPFPGRRSSGRGGND